MPPAPKRPSGFTVEQLTFLAAMRQHFPAKTLVECAKAAKLSSYDKVTRWRDRNKRFRIWMDDLKLELRQAVADKRLAAPERAEDLTFADQLADYVDRWRRTQDRVESASAAGLTYDQVEEARKERPEFEAACARVEKEIQVRLDDARTRAAIAGEPTALNAIRRMAPERPKAPELDRKARQAKLRAEKGAVN